MNVKVLGPGCQNCQSLELHVQKAAKQLGVDVELEKVERTKDIVSFGVMKTPALVIDGKVVSSGKVLTVDQVKELLSQ